MSPTSSGQSYDSAMESMEYWGRLLRKFKSDERLRFFTAPLAPFIDPGSVVFEHPDRFGYKILFRSLEEHRRALLQPSWKYMLNYETDRMTRDDLVQATYDTAERLNEIKLERGLIEVPDYQNSD